MKTYLYLPLFILLAGCSGSNKEEKQNVGADYIINGPMTDEQLKQLIEQEKKNEERAKHSGSGVNIVTIDDAAKVEELKKDFAAKIKAREARKQEQELASLTPAKKYKKGDKTQLPVILKTLNGNDEKEIKSVLNELEKNFDDAPGYVITDPALVKAIFKLLPGQKYEKKVIQLTGYMKMPGYVKIFEDRLCSGKSGDEGRLFYWLGEDGGSTRALDYIAGKLSASKVDFEKDHWVLTGIESYARHGTPENKQKALFICRQLAEKPVNSNNKTSYNDPSTAALRVIMKFGDKNDAPLISKKLDDPQLADEALAALVRIEGSAHKDKILAGLNNPKKFYSASDNAAVLYKLKKDDELADEILKAFEKNGDFEKYKVDRLVKTFVEMGATDRLNNCEKVITNGELVTSIKNSLRLQSMPLQQIADDAFAMGILQKKVDVKTLKQKEDEEIGIISVLDAEGIHLWFDAETGFVPVGYDELINDYIKLSRGKLKDALVWMDAKEINGGENYEYKITLIFNNKAYVIQPEDIGDWYNVEAVTDLLNHALSDAGVSERFVMLDTGDQTVQIIFGDEAKVKAFVKKYEL